MWFDIIQKIENIIYKIVKKILTKSKELKNKNGILTKETSIKNLSLNKYDSSTSSVIDSPDKIKLTKEIYLAHRNGTKGSNLVECIKYKDVNKIIKRSEVKNVDNQYFIKGIIQNELMQNYQTIPLKSIKIW